MTGLAASVLGQAGRTPEAVAILDGDRRLSYAELDTLSASMANALRLRGIEAGQTVALCLPRSWQLACAMLAVLRLGAVVLPLDLQSPPERRRHMLTDAAATLLIHGETSPDPLTVRSVPVTELLAAETEAEQAVLDGEISFIFYTSGTTGLPKGVQVRDAGVLRLAEPGYLRLDGPIRCGWLANPAFDALNFEVWVPLLTGGCCVVLPDELAQAPQLLAAELLARDVDTLFITVALFNAVIEAVPDCFAGLDQLLVGGEQLNAKLISQWYQDNPACTTQLHNVYGPTETSTFALCYPIPRDFAGDLVPIGRPLPGTEAVLVVAGRPAQPGELAELYLGGPAVTAGYRNLPEETAHRFVRLPWREAQVLYRSGDLVRRDAAGQLSYAGRIDRQVKVRGFRIEPGEVEQQLLRHPAIRQAYVCTRRSDGGHELLAYLVLDGQLSPVEFDEHLAAVLPSYMRPHHSYLLAGLPLNQNGKVDQAALLADTTPAWRAEPAADEALTASQDELLGMAGRLLGIPRPRLADRWIASGGDSLSALRLRFEVRRRWGRELPQALVLGQDFAAMDSAIADAIESPYPVLVTDPGARSAPATSEQQRLWLLQQREPQSCAYNVGFALRLAGSLDVPALRQALRRIVVRYPALRTAFQAGPDGLRQLLADPYDPWLELDQAEPDWQLVADQLFGTAFELSGPRLFQAAWLGQAGILLLHLHHIAVDGWSITLLLQALSQEYHAALSGETSTLPGVPTPLDYAGWQADWFAAPGYQAQRAELTAHYAEQDEPGTPLAARSAEGGAGLLSVRLSGQLQAGLDRLGAELELTRFQLLLAAYAWSIYAVTGRDRLRIATPTTNRPLQDFDTSVGMFANTVLIPVRLTGASSLGALLDEHAHDIRAVLDRQDVALADLLVAHDPATRPFDFMFVLENTDFGALTLPGYPGRPEWRPPAAAKCPLTLSVIEHRDGLDCLWEYGPDYLDPTEVNALATVFEQAVGQLVDGRTGTLTELVTPYRQALSSPGRGATVGGDYATIAEGFARQLLRSPDAPALRAGPVQLSYAELDARAEALAAELRDRYRPPEVGPCHVALYLQPSIEHVVSLLALARLNLTIVPLDPAYPPALLRQILSQTRPLCILLAAGDEPALAELDPGNSPLHPVILRSSTAPVAPVIAGRPLYTLFTSGSTGTPKGVQVSDELLANLLQWQGESGGLGTPAATQQFAMLSFDVSFQEVFGTLCAGGCLHLLPPGGRHDLPALLTQLETAGVERIFLPYVALQLLAEHGVRLGRFPSRLREVITAGEQLVCTDAIRGWFAGLSGARLFNHYGPTETHVVSSLCLQGDPASWPARPAIGRPIANTWLRVVDEADLDVPPDCPGQLLIGGPLVAPCYLEDDELNAARFVELPGAGWYFRSGDRASFDQHGALHFLGRDDQQVKLSGHRLELGQVEAALLHHPAIAQAAVVLDGRRLVAAIYCPGQVPTPAELTAHLAPLLPAYVRIDRFRSLAALPLTPSGKLDRRQALSAAGTELSATPASDGSAPAGSVRERQLAELFEQVIGQPIGLDQRFFDAGAGSLGLMRFQLRCTAELGLNLSIPDLFEHVTIRALARHLDGADAVAQNHRGQPSGDRIAVIGMAVRLPGADDLAAFWQLVESGGTGIERFAAAAGLVGARSQLAGPLGFDPAHFGISQQEARLMDPQQRHLLMSCVQALAHAGIANPSGRQIGLIASCGENTYFQSMLRDTDPARLPDTFQLALHHDKDFLATKVAYQLGLTGPAFTVQAACASSLVAVHVAAGLLREGDCELMLAGGVLVDPLLREGYRYRQQHIFSPDGHCRPFSDDAEGTVGASGVGVVVLKPLHLAQRDGDTVYAVIAGSALNNDGATKLGYSAPSVTGQREVIRTALRRSGHEAAEIGYVEAHGTGTPLGDPVEVAALRQAFELEDLDVQGQNAQCAVTSVKSQLGHLGAAAGVVGLIRAVLAVRHGVIPPNIHFRRRNPRIEDGPFYFPDKAIPWPAGRLRVAAVSSFGIGGTNAHLILEAAESVTAGVSDRPLLLLSGSSAAALRADARRIADYLSGQPETYDQVLRHLQAGRPAGRWRMAVSCPDVATAIGWLRTSEPVLAVDQTGRTGDPVADWLAGAVLEWPAGPAQPPWDFPPPSFALADYHFADDLAYLSTPLTTTVPTALAGDWPGRLPEADWLHQPHWVRSHRATSGAAPVRPVVLLLAAAAPRSEQVLPDQITVIAADSFARLDDRQYQVDPADPASLRQLLAALAAAGYTELDWLHALGLAVTGPVDDESLALARWACLDSPAALLQAVSGQPLRIRPWWLSQRAQPVQGSIHRPELGLLAGICEVAPQETGLDGHWLDLPGDDPADWLAALPALLAGQPGSRRLALRDGFWWQQAVLPVPNDEPSWSPPLDGRYLILGGSGGIGSSIAQCLLADPGARLILLSRRPKLPEALIGWADRIELVDADLASVPAESLLAVLGPVDGIVHAAGSASGGLIATREAAGSAPGTEAKLRGALLIERLVERDRPDFVAYCSSMSAQLGGIGQLDYAAANGMLDSLAHYRPSDGTARISIAWDVWRETGMAIDALRSDDRHQAHLAVGLSTAEGQRLFGQALRLRLPQLLISTTPVAEAERFYRAAAGTRFDQPAQGAEATASATVLADALCRWLGVQQLDPAASLYDLGADSLTMLDLIEEIQQRYGVELALSELGHRTSLAEVLSLLEPAPADPVGEGSSEKKDEDELVPLEVWQPGTGRDLLCLIHPVGGDIQAYRALVAALDPRLTVCLIADPALRRTDLPAWSLAERASRYRAALARRFPVGEWRWRLAGWSFGAWVALELAAQAEVAGQPAGELYLLDPPTPDAARTSYDQQQLQAVFAQELGVQDTTQAPHAVAYAQRLAQCCQANLASLRSHTLSRLSSTPSWIWTAGRPAPGLPEPAPSEVRRGFWHRQLAELRCCSELDTTHYGIVALPAVRAIAESINAGSINAGSPVILESC